MKKTLLIRMFLVAIISMAFVACDTRQDRTDDMDNRGTDTYTPGERDNTGITTETERDYMFFDDSRDYTYEERNQFRQDVQEARNRLDQEISRLESQGQNLAADEREDHREKINDLKEKRDELDKEMKGFNRATADNWDDFQDKVQSAWSDVEDSFKDVRDDVHDNINDDNRNQRTNPDRM
jgi:peptidoglycan hydrolase CwlO-like protein